MITCANCESAAEFTLSDPGANPIDYCISCLPPSFRLRASQGELALRVVDEPVVEKTPKKSK